MDVVAPNSTVKRSFNTTRFTSAAPHTLAGTPSMHARVDGGATELTTGLSLSADFDSKTGENQWTLDLSASASYTAGSLVEIFIAAGTVDSVSVAGLKVYEFRIGTSGSLDALITRGLLALPAAASGSGSGLATSTNVSNVETDTQDIQGRLPSALVGGRMDSNVGAISGDSTAADNLEAAADGTGFNLGGGQTVAASVTGNVGGNLTGTIGGLSTAAKAEVQQEAEDALAAYNAAQPGDQMDLVNVPNATAVTALQSGLATAAALATLAGKFTGITLLADWLRCLFRSDTNFTGRATALSELNDSATPGDASNVTESLEAVRDRGDAAWTTGVGGGGGDEFPIQPYSSSAPQRVIGTRITLFEDEFGMWVTMTSYSAHPNGRTPLDLTGKTLRFIVESNAGTVLATLDEALGVLEKVDEDGGIWRFKATAEMSAAIAENDGANWWDLSDVTGGTIDETLAWGRAWVQRRAGH